MVGLVDAYGNTVVSYTYDAWGNPESTTGSMASTLGVDNPFRYRSYYFDTESGLYYLMSRYYDPVVGRFLNADRYVSTGQGITGNNMFVYCGNNSINRYDSDGKMFKRSTDIILVPPTPLPFPSVKTFIATSKQSLSNKMPIEGGKKKNDWPRYPSGSSHSGTDIQASVGTPVHAVESGTVIRVSDKINFNTWNNKKYTGLDTYGTYIFIQTDSGVEMRYAHLSKINVEVGQHVKAWDIIGLSGNTGNSSGPHLHFEVRKNGKVVNPFDYIR